MAKIVGSNRDSNAGPLAIVFRVVPKRESYLVCVSAEIERCVTLLATRPSEP